jgi:hypothetical protein
MGHTWVTVPTCTVSKNELSKLPEEVLSLVSLGQYSLYRAIVAEHPNYRYVLRTGEQKFFFLEINSEPVASAGSEKFNIQEKLTLPRLKARGILLTGV